MIVVRNVFRLKFGKARDALAVWKEGLGFLERAGVPARLLTDLSGASYTLVLENSYESLSAFERVMKDVMANPQWREWYQKFVPLAEAGHREILTVVE